MKQEMLVCDPVRQRAAIQDVCWCLQQYAVVIRQSIRDELYESDELYDELSTIADSIEEQIQKLKEI